MEEQNTTFDDVNRVRGVKSLIEKFESMNVQNVHASGAPEDWNLKNLEGRVASTAAKLEMGNDSINEDQVQWIAEPKDEILNDIAGRVSANVAKIEHNIFPFEAGKDSIKEDQVTEQWNTEPKDEIFNDIAGRVKENVAKIEHNIFPFEIRQDSIKEDQATEEEKESLVEVKDKMLRYFYPQIKNNTNDIELADEDSKEMQEINDQIIPTEGSSNDELTVSSHKIKKTPCFNGFDLGNYSNNLFIFFSH